MSAGPPIYVSLHGARCWDCKVGECPDRDHPWWEADDVRYAERRGLEPPSGSCACACARQP